MIDYKSIIEQLDNEKVKSLLDKLDIPYIDKETYLLMPTVCHHSSADEASYKLYYYKDSHLFYCYSNCGGQSIFTFLKHYYEERGYTYDWYTDIYQLIAGCSYFSETQEVEDRYKAIRSDYQVSKNIKELPTYDEGVLETFIKFYTPEWLNDGIAPAAMDKFGIRYSVSQNKIIIPHYDVKGNLIGIRGRALNPEDIENFGKYMPVQVENTWYSHPLSLNLYGLYENRTNIKRTGICYIGEGEKFVLQNESFNMVNCSVAVCGSNLNKYALNILFKTCHPREVVLCFDKEASTHHGDYFKYLYDTCLKYNKYCNFSFIYDTENLLELKQSPTDRGEDIFKQLLKRRVKVYA